MLRMCEMIAKILLLQLKIALSLPQNTPLCPPPRWNFSRDFYCLCGGGWRQNVRWRHLLAANPPTPPPCVSVGEPATFNSVKQCVQVRALIARHSTSPRNTKTPVMRKYHEQILI